MKADETTLRETRIVRRLAKAAGLDVWKQGGLLRIGRKAAAPDAIVMDRFVSVSAFRPVTGAEKLEDYPDMFCAKEFCFAPGVKELAGARMVVAGRVFSVPEWMGGCSSLDEVEIGLAAAGF